MSRDGLGRYDYNMTEKIHQIDLESSKHREIKNRFIYLGIEKVSITIIKNLI